MLNSMTVRGNLEVDIKVVKVLQLALTFNLKGSNVVWH